MFQVFKPHAGEDYKYPRETETIWSHPYIVEGYPKNPLESLSLHICWAAMAPSITSSQDSIPSQTDKKSLSLDLSLTRKKRYQGLHWSHWQGLNHMTIKIHTPGQGSPSLGQNWSWGNRKEKGVTQ
ncbi:PREDICTED: putative uncharacterized protein C20orf78 homolog isoform X1 [Colobus angolensis palliatus]|uniref:putative uncharacterized protein C20orf78 homolog isoform X1 n=1 Tax=Colobus angolensis palliatus TaxID=336983 RepID=UPI0005F4B39A|nr:PREDICTED: putative uncharacterized protein C20orf78 homolog isoform X1 [Colobus angolensis palliatus]